MEIYCPPDKQTLVAAAKAGFAREIGCLGRTSTVCPEAGVHLQKCLGYVPGSTAWVPVREEGTPRMTQHNRRRTTVKCCWSPHRKLAGGRSLLVRDPSPFYPLRATSGCLVPVCRWEMGTVVGNHICSRSAFRHHSVGRRIYTGTLEAFWHLHTTGSLLVLS